MGEAAGVLLGHVDELEGDGTEVGGNDLPGLDRACVGGLEPADVGEYRRQHQNEGRLCGRVGGGPNTVAEDAQRQRMVHRFEPGAGRPVE